MQTLTIRKPDDFHLHLRDGEELQSIVADTALRFARAIIMPNLKPAVTTVEEALAYRERIFSVLPDKPEFQPLMTLYLTEKTAINEIEQAAKSDHVYAVKYYPAGATTNAESGVTDIENVYPQLEAMAESNLPLLMHGEVTDADVDIFDRESEFIGRILSPLLERFDSLRIVLEHITTSDAVGFVMQGPESLAATITPHHLLMNRNRLFSGGLRPHHYCLPVLKAEQHRQAVVTAATSGNPRFFLGTDSAPHAQTDKESACGCAGIYSAHNAIELYAEVFEAAGCLDRLEDFSSRFGAAFYGLPLNEQTVTLINQTWHVPASLPFGSGRVVPLRAGKDCQWQLRQ